MTTTPSPLSEDVVVVPTNQPMEHAPETGACPNWRREVRELWWVPRATLPAGMIVVLHLARFNPLDLLTLIPLEISALALPIIVVPVAKEIAYRWSMEIRYGRKEAARRRRSLP